MTKAYEEIVDFVAAGASRESLIGFEASRDTKIRVEYLLLKEKSDGLLPEEKVELDDYLQLEHLLRLVKARAKSMVSGTVP